MAGCPLPVSVETSVIMSGLFKFRLDILWILSVNMTRKGINQMQRSTFFVLPAIAGFVDTSTFMHVSGLFAAHFTGNFILFAAALTRGATPNDYLKLISFPFFIIAVWGGTLVYNLALRRGTRVSGVSCLLLIEAILLLSVGLIAMASNAGRFEVPLAMTLVVAMGLQNVLHYFTPGPMSTAMTANAMRWAAVLAERFIPVNDHADSQKVGATSVSAPSRQPIGKVILSFATGCMFSAFIPVTFGLAANILPGMAVLVLALMEEKYERQHKVSLIKKQVCAV